MDLQRDGFGGLDNNGAGLMIAMGVPICYILWEACKGWFRWVFLMGAPILAYAVTLTYSRGAMVSILACLPMMLMLSQRKKYVIGAYILGAAFILGTSGPQLRDRFFSVSKHDADESANARKTAWKIAIKMASEKPFFGMGIRCSQLKTFDYGADFENMAIHNTYLQFAADSGWLAMVWYIGLLGSAIILSVIFWYRTRRWPQVVSVIQARAVAAAVACSLTVFMVGSFFLSLETFEMPYILALIGGQLWAVYRAGGVEVAAVNDMYATIAKNVPTNEFRVRESFKRSPKPFANQQISRDTSTDTPEPTGDKTWDVLLEHTEKKSE
jgi:O-antigen ligase